MDSLPPKVYWMLIDYLSVSDLHSLVSCSRSIHKKAKPMLYRVLRLDFDNGNVKPQTLLLLRTLMHSPELTKFVRSVEFLNTGSSIWTQGHSQLLSLILVRMNLHPERVTAFSTTSSWVPLNTYHAVPTCRTYPPTVHQKRFSPYKMPNFTCGECYQKERYFHEKIFIILRIA